MITLKAPWPAIQTVTYLPNPEFGDTENLVQTISTFKSMNNTRYTYVKTRDSRRTVNFRFNLTQAKAFELMEFIRAYHRIKIQMTDHLGQVWLGYIITNPNEVESRALAIKNATAMYGHGGIQIQFEGFKQ